MTIEVRWLDEPEKTLFYSFQGYWTWDEFSDAINKTIAMTLDRTGALPVLIDMRDSKNMLPANLTTRAQHTSELADGHLSPVIVVGAGQVWQVFVTVMRAMGNDLAHQVQFVDSFETAYALLNPSEVHSV